MNPLIVHLFDINTSRVNTQLLNMCHTTGQTFCTAATMFKKTDYLMTKLQLLWSNCVGFSLENIRANLGVRNSIKTRSVLKNENCYPMRCPCHIIHNTTHKGSVGFTRVTKV